MSALAIAAAACDSRGVPTAPARPGAERAVPAASGLAATTPGRQYDNDARAVDETRTAAFGSIVAGRGGQKAQQEAASKEAADREGRARDVAQREAAQRDAAKGATPPPSARATVSPPPAPAVTSASIPPVTPAPAPIPAAPIPAAPIQAAPISAPPPASAPVVEQATVAPAPVPSSAPAPVVTTVAARPADPNKAFVPPPGWVPPGQTTPVQTSPVQTSPIQTAAIAPPAPPEPRPVPPPAPVVSAPLSAPPPAPPSATLSPVATPPIRGADIMMGAPAASAPPPPMASQRAPERAPNPVPAPSSMPMPAAAAPAPVMAAPAPQPAPASIPVPQPAPITEANIAAAQSGSVPSSALTSPPLSGPMQVAVIQFGRNSAGLSANDIDVLTRVAQIQRRNGGTVRVLGHALKDVVGSSVSEIKNGNLNLSIKRAEAVAQLLVRNGVPADAIVMEGVSDEEPVYETRTARGIAANRRAEVFLDL